MTYTVELLDHARRLLSSLDQAPTQADLRRSVSSSYYAIFNLLVTEAANRVGRDASQAVRLRIVRAFQHREMRWVCEQFLKVTAKTVPKSLEGIIVAPLSPDLTLIAETFSELQDARHLADYDFEQPVTYLQAAAMLGNADRSMTAWDAIKDSPETTTFLTALLLADRWTRRG